MLLSAIEAVEISTNVAVDVLNNYINNVARTDMDVAVVLAARAA